ncbi:hypothetical protein MKEN_01265500 [Mycena kentingensis (nom. inval.)]|nr:hypothetical protein MKEN_01265500 [Mycena kentingensis (nom. inval.)]
MPASHPRTARALRTVLLHARKHTGVGIVCAVAYFDPGNWAVDLAGSDFGFSLLFMVLLAGVFAAYLQTLGTRLGCVTGLDLASHCRVLLYDRPKHKRLLRWGVLYPLYAIAEVGIIATDLAELLGSAIALVLLFPSLELWQGVLITAFDVVLLLALRDPLRSTPVKWFEILIAILVIAVLVCMVIIVSRLHVQWDEAFRGFLPSKQLFAANGLYTSVGILGATIMPHSLFLGSTLATQRRVEVEREAGPEPTPSPVVGEENKRAADEQNALPSVSRRSSSCSTLSKVGEYFVSSFRTPPPSAYATQVKRHADRENNSLRFIKKHLNHAIFDVVGSLLGFAVLINSMILIIAAMVFHYGDQTVLEESSASLFDAYLVIRGVLGKVAATLFAIALLAAGQSASLIATVAGQAVSEGFLNWRVSPIVRRLLTRLLAVIPSMTVAVALGRRGIDDLLVASQVILSVVLPFIILPLILFTSSKTVMRVRNPDAQVATNDGESSDVQMIDYSMGRAATLIGLAIWLVILTANVPFSTTSPVLKRREIVTRRTPSKKSLAAKARRRAAKEAALVDHSDDMTLEAAIAVLRAVEVARPKGCFELFVKADLRSAPGSGGGVTVPKGRINIPYEPKPKAEDTIMVFAENKQAEEARRAGATIVGGTEMIEGVLSGRLRANTILCTPDLIKAITPRLGRFLGPMGLMPSTRRGTVTDDIEGYVKRVKGSTEWKADRAGNIRMPIGRMDFPTENVVKNFRFVLESIKRATGNVKLRDPKEANQRKVIPIRKVTLSTRSSPGIPITDY